MPFWDDLRRRQAEDWTFLRLTDAPSSDSPTTLESERHYLSITLKSARVVNVRRGLNRFYGTVSSFIEVPHLSGERVSVNVVTTPGNLKNIDASRIDRIIQLDNRLLGPVPYHGGELGIEIGLFSIKAVDLAAPYLELLESLGKLAGVSFLSVATAFARPLVTGVNLLLGAGDTAELEVGIAASAWQPELGYFAIIRAAKGTYDASNLRVTETDNRLVDANGNTVSQYPYMVIEVEALASRPDWFMIPDLSKSYQALQAAVLKDSVEDVRETLGLFQRTAATSADLLIEDAQRLADLVEEQTRQKMRGKFTSRVDVERGVGLGLPDLEKIPLFGLS